MSKSKKSLIERTTTDKNLKYFVIMGSPVGAVFKQLIENPSNPIEGAAELLDGIPGAKLIDYYLFAGQAKNLAIVAVPDSKDAAAILYQRMATEMVLDIEIHELIPGEHMPDVFEAAKKLTDGGAYGQT